MTFSPVHFAVGPVVVSWNSQQIGYSEDGVQGIIQPRYDEIFSDDMGGRAGVPTDAQLLAGICSMDIVFTKYMKSICDGLSNFNANTVASQNGLFPAIGSFVRQDSLGASLVLTGVNETKTFALAFLRRNYEVNSGSRYRRYVCGFECWVNQTDFTALTSAQTRRMHTVS